MAPELFNGSNYNSKVDIWSLGCVLYEMISLKKPFESTNYYSLTIKIIRGKYPALPPNTRPEFVKLINSMLQINPSNRASINTIISNPFINNAISNFDYETSDVLMDQDDDIMIAVDNSMIAEEKPTFSRDKITDEIITHDIEAFAANRIRPEVREEVRIALKLKIRRKREEMKLAKEVLMKRAEEEQKKKELEKSRFKKKHEEQKKKELEMKKQQAKEYKQKISVRLIAKI